MTISSAAAADGAGDIRVGVIGDYDPDILAHRAIPEAVRLAAERLAVRAEAIWLATEELPARPEEAYELLRAFDALWCAPGSQRRAHVSSKLLQLSSAATQAS